MHEGHPTDHLGGILVFQGECYLGRVESARGKGGIGLGDRPRQTHGKIGDFKEQSRNLV